MQKTFPRSRDLGSLRGRATLLLSSEAVRRDCNLFWNFISDNCLSARNSELFLCLNWKSVLMNEKIPTHLYFDLSKFADILTFQTSFLCSVYSMMGLDCCGQKLGIIFLDQVGLYAVELLLSHRTNEPQNVGKKSSKLLISLECCAGLKHLVSCVFITSCVESRSHILPFWESWLSGLWMFNILL